MTCQGCIEKDRQIAFLKRKIARMGNESILDNCWGEVSRRAMREIAALDKQEAAMGPEESTR